MKLDEKLTRGVQGLVVLILMAASALGQETPPVEPETPQAEVAAAAPLSITGWELREVLLDPPQRDIQDDGSVRLRTWGFQLVLRAKDFPVRALDPQIHLGDRVLKRYEWCGETTDCIVFTFWDPEILRAERSFTVIYEGDERTRTRLQEPFDPERLERLPKDVREQAGLPELEGGVIEELGEKVVGHLRLESPARTRVAWRVGDAWEIAPTDLEVDPAGRFELSPEGLSEATRVALLRLPPEVETVPSVIRGEWPKGWEVLDLKSRDGEGR